MTNYAEFLASKRPTADPAGFEVSPLDLNPKLFKFQSDLTRWSLKLGRKGVGIELKPEYWNPGRKYLKATETSLNQVDLFTYAAQQTAEQVGD